MSVVSILEQHESRTGDWKLVMPPGRIDRTYQRIYQVLTDNDLDDLNVVLTAMSVSTIALGNQYPSDNRAYCVSMKGDKIDRNPFAWRVVADFQSYFQFDPATLQENPLLRNPVYSITWNGLEKAVTKDLDGDPIENSAHVPFIPPLTLTQGVPTMEISWNAALLTFADLQDNFDCCNNDTWNGLAPTSVLIKGISYNRVTENNVTYWQKKATVSVCSLDTRPLGWEYEEVLDQGFSEYNLANNIRTLIRGSNGEPLPEPTLLKNGVKKPAADDPVYLASRMRRKVNLVGLIPTL